MNLFPKKKGNSKCIQTLKKAATLPMIVATSSSKRNHNNLFFVFIQYPNGTGFYFLKLFHELLFYFKKTFSNFRRDRFETCPYPHTKIIFLLPHTAPLPPSFLPRPAL